MLGDSASIVLSLIFSSLGLIFFIYYFIIKIAGFDVEDAVRRSKHAEIFEDRHDSMNAALIQKDNSMENTKFYFNFIYDNVQQFIQDFFSYQNNFVLFCSILFVFIVIFLLEEYIGSFYVTCSYIVGILFCILMHLIASKFGRSALGIMIFNSIEGDSDALHETFQSSYNTGLALIIFFLSSFNILMIIMTACFRSLYVSNSTRDEYENMFTLLTCGFTLAYCFGCFFYRVSGAIYTSSMAATADLIGKSDEEIKSENFFNPCSLPNQVACFYKNFMSSFSDITSVFLMVFSGILILTCGSENFTGSKASFYFIQVYFGFTILMALFSAIFLNFSIFNAHESASYCSKNYRSQLFLSHLFSIAFNIFIPLVIFENDFSYFMQDDKPIPEKISNYYETGVSRGWFILCLFMGYMAEIVLLISSEFFTSHMYRPVRSLLDKSENGPCLNLFSTMIISLITYFIPIFAFFICFFVCYGVLGFLGIALCGLGLIGNIIPLFVINCISSFAEHALKLGKLSKIFQEEDYKKNPLFNILWDSQNFLMHLRIVNFGGFFFGGFAMIGCIVSRAKVLDLLTLKTCQLTGLIFGSFVPFLLAGMILGMVQKLLQTNSVLAKKQFSYFPGIKKGLDKPDFMIIFADARSKSLLFSFILFVFNFLVIYFYGLFFGIEGIFGVLITMILISNYLIYSSFLSGTALANSKSYSDNNNSIEEYGPIAASVSIGEMISLLSKESTPSLIIIMIFNLMLCVLSLRTFDETGWIASSVGLH